MSLSVNIPITLDTAQVERDSNDIEYEIKLECLDTKKPLSGLLDMVETALTASRRYLVDRVQIVSQMTSHFLVDGENEYSVFRYDGEVMLKVKKHEIITGRKLPIFKNFENFFYDIDKINSKLQHHQITYVGSMLKRRIKDFIIDSNDGRVYSLAITICETNDQRQHQLEVEYYGYVRGSEKQKLENESALLDRLVELSAYIQRACPSEFLPSVERKYEFVVKHGSVTQSDANNKKKHLLKNLEAI